MDASNSETTKEDFEELLGKAIKPSQSSPQTKGERVDGDYTEKKIHQRKAEDTSGWQRGTCR